jgi:uncharacterized membrane protein
MVARMDKKTLVKAVLWETISLVLSFMITMLVLGNVGTAGILSAILFVVKSLVLYAYEKAWDMWRR